VGYGGETGTLTIYYGISLTTRCTHLRGFVNSLFLKAMKSRVKERLLISYAIRNKKMIATQPF